MRINCWIVGQFGSVWFGWIGSGLLAASATEAQEDYGQDRGQTDYPTDNSACYSTGFRLGL
jgi:hypothetical protein